MNSDGKRCYFTIDHWGPATIRIVLDSGPLEPDQTRSGWNWVRVRTMPDPVLHTSDHIRLITMFHQHRPSLPRGGRSVSPNGVGRRARSPGPRIGRPLSPCPSGALSVDGQRATARLESRRPQFGPVSIRNRQVYFPWLLAVWNAQRIRYHPEVWGRGRGLLLLEWTAIGLRSRPRRTTADEMTSMPLPMQTEIATLSYFRTILLMECTGSLSGKKKEWDPPLSQPMSKPTPRAAS